jgi:hypothetical protein
MWTCPYYFLGRHVMWVRDQTTRRKQAHHDHDRTPEKPHDEEADGKDVEEEENEEIVHESFPL